MTSDLTTSPVDRQNMDMTEHQTVEYKQRWKDDYLKWLCGFANAGGGVLVIGRNDDGKTVGVVHASKLLGKENRK